MSDSDLSDVPSATIPSDTVLENSLREEVQKAAEAEEEYTVRTIRKASETTLDLPEDFYKTHAKWNERSKTIIKAEADSVAQSKEKKTSTKTEPPKTKASSGATSSKKDAPKRPPKRASPTGSKQPEKKKRKVSSDDDSSAMLSSPPSDLEESPVQGPSKSRKAVVSKAKKSQNKSNTKVETDPDSDVQDPEDTTLDHESTPESDANSGSEMSDVLDDELVKKKRSKSKDLAEKKPPKGKSSTTKAAAETDPDKEEIKKLQSWLVKCGVRKVWGKELKPYETSKSKIKHLKEMLTDVGMTGRFSNEKAAGIKEARELAADIEAVQEGAQRWGKEGDDEDGEEAGDKTRSGRRLVRGAKNYDFLSSDGEETD